MFCCFYFSRCVFVNVMCFGRGCCVRDCFLWALAVARFVVGLSLLLCFLFGDGCCVFLLNVLFAVGCCVLD